jgi:hypothetical protein
MAMPDYFYYGAIIMMASGSSMQGNFEAAEPI